MIWKWSIFLSLFMGFLLLLRGICWLQVFSQLLKQTMRTMDEAARKRLLHSRTTLLEIQRKHSIWFWLEQELQYSGLKRNIPGITSENWLVGNLVILTMILFIGICIFPKLWMSVCTIFALILMEYFIISFLKMRSFRKVERNLMKFLDFLGNYSMTAGEITSIFHQVSKYVEEPLKSVLEECCVEAQMTGDASMALLTMSEKIEHPKFKEIVRNMEISIRYCADFKILVNRSRRSVREYLRASGEQKNILQEAGIHLFLLVGLSVVIFLIVDGLIDISIWQVLFFTIPGRIALAILMLIFVLFLRQIMRI